MSTHLFELTIGNISQIVCRRGRAWAGPAELACGRARSQVGHARSAARVALGGLGARPAHKHALAHELRSSRFDSERPRARFNFSTNLLWNLSSRGTLCGLAEPLLGLSAAARSEVRDGGARQYDSERMAGTLRCGLSVCARGDSAGPSERDSDTLRTRPPSPAFSADSDTRRVRCELYRSQSFFTTGIMNAISATVTVILGF